MLHRIVKTHNFSPIIITRYSFVLIKVETFYVPQIGVDKVLNI